MPDALQFWLDRGFPIMLANALTGEGISTEEQLRATSREELLRIPNLGQLSYRKIQAFLGRSTEADVAEAIRPFLRDDVDALEVARLALKAAR